MSVLRRFPRWLQVLLLGVDLVASLVVLVHWWAASYPNLIAAWFQFSAVAALAVPLGAWLGRKLDQRQEHIARRTAEHTAAHLTEHHDMTRTHVTKQLAAHAATQGERLAVISDQIAAINQRLDQQGGDS